MAPRKTTPPSPPLIELTIVVHTTNGEFEVPLGKGTEEALKDIRENIDTAFYTLKATRRWGVTDLNKNEFIFNSDHIVCIELRIGDQ